MLALRLAKAGYYGGDPDAVLAARVDTVLDIVQFEQFQNEYEAVEYELNKGD